MKIRLLVDCHAGRKGKVIDTPWHGVANLLIRCGKAVLLEEDTPPQKKRQRRTEKAVKHG